MNRYSLILHHKYQALKSTSTCSKLSADTTISKFVHCLLVIAFVGATKTAIKISHS